MSAVARRYPSDSTRVTYGTLNLTHRDSHEMPQPLEPGQRYTVRLQLNDIGYAIPKGHRLRIALSTAYWPILWPSQETAQLTLFAGALELPVRNRQPEDAHVTFGPPLAPPHLGRTVLRPGKVIRTVSRDIATGVASMEIFNDEGVSRIDENGIVTEDYKSLSFRIADDDPLSARAEAHVKLINANTEGWNSRVETHSTVSCTATAFFVEADLHAFEDEQRMFSRSWTKSIPRQLL